MTVAVSLDWLTNQNGETYVKFVPEGFRLRINSENFGAQAINLSFVVASVWPYRESLSIQNKLEWALIGQLLDSDFIPKMVHFREQKFQIHHLSERAFQLEDFLS